MKNKTTVKSRRTPYISFKNMGYKLKVSGEGPTVARATHKSGLNYRYLNTAWSKGQGKKFTRIRNILSQEYNCDNIEFSKYSGVHGNELTCVTYTR